MPQPATGYAAQTRPPRYWVKRVIEDSHGGPPRFHIIGYSHPDLMAAYEEASALRRMFPMMTFVAGEMCIDG
jgi:hypothetical protein